MRAHLLASCLLISLISSAIVNGDSSADLVNVKVDRQIDLSTNVVHILNVITVENKATSGALKSYTFVVEPSLADHVAIVSSYVITYFIFILTS